MMISPYLAFSEISKVSPFPPCLEGRCQLTRHDNVLALFFKASEAVSAVSTSYSACSRILLNVLKIPLSSSTMRIRLFILTSPQCSSKYGTSQ